ncbi:MAG: DUF945 family protein, partial [Burkholderiales bacterium]|nr:DUF945 family protein [Burkholderiales bacterium]
EHEYQQQIARWSQQTGQVNMRVERFDRGWFASTAITAIDVPTPSAENSAAVTTLRLVHQITHGPLAHDETLVVKPALASIHTTLELPAPLAAPTQ